ncbi:MAG: sigma-70 family RNA polymerase sigma factor [Chloroflexota bacterium]|nr:sigma-70 family RNA polymerase sigma factor [Chloroflexota bacterium]
MDTGLEAENEGLRPAGATAGEVEEHFEKAYRRLRDPVFHYVRRFALDDDEAAELTGRTFERALTRLSSYRGGRDGMGAWLFRIARSQASMRPDAAGRSIHSTSSGPTSTRTASTDDPSPTSYGAKRTESWPSTLGNFLNSSANASPCDMASG